MERLDTEKDFLEVMDGQYAGLINWAKKNGSTDTKQDLQVTIIYNVAIQRRVFRMGFGLTVVSSYNPVP